MCVLNCFSRVQFFVTPWTVTSQAPLMGFSKQEYWSGLPCPLGDLPNPGIELASPELVGRFFTSEPQGRQELVKIPVLGACTFH